jgi:hypothetical protein
MNLMNVLRGDYDAGQVETYFIGGVRTATLGGEEGSMGLSSVVKAAVHEAVMRHFAVSAKTGASLPESLEFLTVQLAELAQKTPR